MELRIVSPDGSPATLGEADFDADSADNIEPTFPDGGEFDSPNGNVLGNESGVSAGFDSRSNCVVCGDPIPYGGRGKPPTKCALHRKSTNSGNIRPDRAAGNGGTYKGFQGEARLREALNARYQGIAMAVSIFNPIYAKGIRDNIDSAVDADIEYARTNASFRRFLEGGVEKSAAAGVIAAHAKMLAPIVIGEKVKAARKGAQAAAQGGSNGPTVFRPDFGRRPSRPTQTPQQAPSDDDFMPGQSSPPNRDTVNAGAMPGMPG